MGLGSALASARLSGTTRGQIRFSDNGDHIESAYEIRVYVHAILFCPESRSREAIPSKIELICPTTRANHLLLVGRAQAVAIATSKGGRADVVSQFTCVSKRPDPDITRSSIQTHLLAQSPRR
jgi:hypothetical protein